jgi:uncharacterized membrane protein
MSDQSELLIIVYEGEQRAAQAAEEVKALHHEHLVDLNNMAIITRNKDGAIDIHESNDPTAGQGVAFGALIGGAIGLLKDHPVQGAALGAAGGYLASRLIDLGFDDTTLRAIAEGIKPDSSALVLAVEFKDLDATARRLAPYGGTVLRDTSPDSVSARFAQALGQGVVDSAAS